MPPKKKVLKKKKKRNIKKYNIPVLEEVNSQQKLAYLKQIKDLEDIVEK
jgi:hypothetical protein